MKLILIFVVCIIITTEVSCIERSNFITHFPVLKKYASKAFAQLEKNINLEYDTKASDFLTILKSKTEILKSITPSSFKDLDLSPFSHILSSLNKKLKSILALFEVVNNLLPETQANIRKRSPSTLSSDCTITLTPLSSQSGTEILIFVDFLNEAKDLLDTNGNNLAAARSFLANTAFYALASQVQIMLNYADKWHSEIDNFKNEISIILTKKKLGPSLENLILASKCEKKLDSIAFTQIDDCVYGNRIMKCAVTLTTGTQTKIFFHMKPYTINHCQIDMDLIVDDKYIPYEIVGQSSLRTSHYTEIEKDQNPCIAGLVTANEMEVIKHCKFKKSFIDYQLSYKGITFNRLSRQNEKKLNALNIFPQSTPFTIQYGSLNLILEDGFVVNFSYVSPMVLFSPPIPFNISQMCDLPTNLSEIFKLERFIPSIIFTSIVMATFLTFYTTYKLYRRCCSKRRKKRAKHSADRILLRTLSNEARRRRR